METDAHYWRPDYRFSTLLSALTLDAAIYEFLRQILMSFDELVGKLLQTDRFGKVLGLKKPKVDTLREAFEKGERGKEVRTLICKWLERAELGNLIGALEDLGLAQGLGYDVMIELKEINERRKGIVHPRSWSKAQSHEEEARKARSVARRFLLGTSQLPSRPF
jgi:hypothetical protein